MGEMFVRSAVVGCNSVPGVVRKHLQTSLYDHSQQQQEHQQQNLHFHFQQNRNLNKASKMKRFVELVSEEHLQNSAGFSFDPRETILDKRSEEPKVMRFGFGCCMKNSVAQVVVVAVTVATAADDDDAGFVESAEFELLRDVVVVVAALRSTCFHHWVQLALKCQRVQLDSTVPCSLAVVAVVAQIEVDLKNLGT